MYALELFKNCDSKSIVESLTSVPNFFELIDWNNTIDENEKNRLKAKIKTRYIEEVEKIKEKSVNFNSKKILMVTRRLYEDNDTLDISLLNVGEIEKVKDYIKDVEDFKNPLYGIIFSDRNEILGYKISEDSLKRYKAEVVASLILRDITSMGIDEVACVERQEEIISSLEETSKRVLSGEEKTYTEEEVWESLGLEPESEEEKERKRQEAVESTMRYIKGIIDDIKLTIEAENL